MRHDFDYFPVMQQHFGWKVYDEPPFVFYATELTHPRADDVVLEIGCGFGQWMVPLSKLVKMVVGVDISDRLRTKAMEKFVEYGIKNAAFVVNDGLTLPFSDGLFSLVYSVSVFQHMPRSTVAGYIAETKRVLKRGGRFAFHFRHADDGIYAEDIGVLHDGDFSVGWTKQEAEKLILECGLHGVAIGDGQSFIVAGVRII